jgi:hypothetical protein
MILNKCKVIKGLIRLARMLAIKIGVVEILNIGKR